MTFGEKVKAERTKLGLNQDELAEKIGTKQHAITRIEKGAFNIGFDTLQSIAEVFGLRIDFIK